MSIAVVFPGQGSQAVGMGVDLASNTDLFNITDKILGYKLSDLMFYGPQEALTLTMNTQPALLLHSMILWDLCKAYLEPEYFAGHSLGEYSAVTAAGGLAFADAVEAVYNRGKFMQEAVPEGIGGMAAALGAMDKVVEELCKSVSTPDSYVCPANYNCPGQVVVSGHIDALERFAAGAKGVGIKRVIPLSVSAPFHCMLMQPAQDLMKSYLSKIPIQNLIKPVVNNVDVVEETDADTVKSALIRQVTGAVRWTQTIEYLISKGVNHFIEIGAGSVLTGLIKKINKDIKYTNISKLNDIEKIKVNDI